jgi:hypothetical protein
MEVAKGRGRVRLRRAPMLPIVLSMIVAAGFATAQTEPSATELANTVTVTSTTRDEIVATAQAEIGASVSNGRCTKYGPCLTLDWCAMFATWVWEQAGVPNVPRDEFVARGLGKWGVDNGLFKARPAGTRGSPAKGDWVIYGSPDGATGGHVSIVQSVNSDGTINTIDGNSTGEAVVSRRINPITATAGRLGDLISGYVTPPGLDQPPPPMITPLGSPVAIYNGVLQVYGVGGNSAVYQSVWDSSAFTFTEWDREGIKLGQFVGRPSVVEYENDLHVFARGANNGLYEQVWTPGSGWRADWFRHGAGLISGNPAVIVYNGSLQVYAPGFDANGGPGAMYADTFNRDTRQWSGWNAVPGVGRTFHGMPAPVQFGNTLHVFARGVNDALYEQVWTPGTGWRADWFRHGAQLIGGDPAAIVYGSSLQVYAAGPTADSGLLQLAWSAQDDRWLDWRALPGGGTFVGKPSAIPYGGQLHVFGRGANNQLYEQVWRPQWLTNWSQHLGTLSGDPVAITFGKALQVYAIGVDDNDTPGGPYFQRNWDGDGPWQWNRLPAGEFTG